MIDCDAGRDSERWSLTGLSLDDEKKREFRRNFGLKTQETSKARGMVQKPLASVQYLLDIS
jgi:hypothetical protein